MKHPGIGFPAGLPSFGSALSAEVSSSSRSGVSLRAAAATAAKNARSPPSLRPQERVLPL